MNLWNLTALFGVSVQRLDRVGRLDSPRKDSRGALRVPSHPTRTGVFIYRNADGSERRELRHPEEVFKKDSLATLAGVPVTIGHPTEPVTVANWKQYAVGHIGDNVREDGPKVAADTCVTESAAVARAESKELIELSCGYTCDLDATPGVFNGERYDAIQRNIEYNHVALLPAGHARGGSEVRMHLDEGELVEGVPAIAPAREDNVSSMELEALKKENSELKARVDSLEAELTKTRARADSATAAAAPELIDARVASAVKLREDARKVLEGELPKTENAIRIAVITKRDPSFKYDAKEHPEAYLAARFDSEMAAHGREQLAKVQTETQRSDGAKDPVEAARLEMNRKNAERFTKGA